VVAVLNLGQGKLMHARRYWVALSLLPALLFAGVVAVPAQEKASPPKAELKVAKYDQLADTVRQLRGKVVVVDFWGISCLPCKKNFPHLVQMQQKYGSQGLAVVSVAIRMDEDISLAEEQSQVLTFLRQQNATFPNLFLDESAAFYQPKLHFEAVPCVYVFNRDGRWYQFKDEFEYADVEKRVVELLKK
jgi:thiol-disulfide isomerase/thioredoxin